MIVAANPKHVSKAALSLVEQSKVESVKVADTRKPKVVKPDTTSVLGQIKFCLQAQNRMAMSIGAVFGAFVPTAASVLIHQEIPQALAVGNYWLVAVKAIFIFGALVFSALTVNQWGKRVFKDGRKALGFTVLLEGTMLISSTTWLAYSALALLNIINAVATGVNLALGHKATEEN